MDFVLCFLLHMTSFNLATLNINGARDVRKRAQLFELVKQKHIDVLFAQETHSDEKNVADWIREWNGKIFFSHKSALSGGVAILFSRSWVPLTLSVDNIIAGHLLKVQATFEHCTFVFLCVYASSTGIDRVLF